MQHRHGIRLQLSLRTLWHFQNTRTRSRRLERAHAALAAGPGLRYGRAMKTPLPQNTPQKQMPPMQPTPPAAAPVQPAPMQTMSQHIRATHKAKLAKDDTGAY